MRNGFALAAAMALAACSSGDPALTNRTQMQGAFVGYVVAKSAIGDAKAVEKAARDACRRTDHCWLLGYGSLAEMPDPALPVPGQNRRPVFAYTKNAATGLDRALFDCRVFKGLPDSSCLAG